MRPANHMLAKRAMAAFVAQLRQAGLSVTGPRGPLLGSKERAGLEDAARAALDATAMIHTPFTSDEVEALNRFQDTDFIHPFTCANDHGDLDRRLRATHNGWICPHCDYTQDWAHGFMLLQWA